MNNQLLKGREVLITRPALESQDFKLSLEKKGVIVHTLPTIKIDSNPNVDRYKDTIKDIQQFNWIIFTSSNGVKYFLEAAVKYKIDPTILKHIKIATVGPATTSELHRRGLTNSFTPKTYDAKSLATEIPVVWGEKILIPRADIAATEIDDILKKRGAVVQSIPVYQTATEMSNQKELNNLLLQKPNIYVTVTSASAIIGLIENITTPELAEKVKNYIIISIGQATTEAAKKYGFKKITTATEHTIEGVINAISSLYIL